MVGLLHARSRRKSGWRDIRGVVGGAARAAVLLPVLALSSAGAASAATYHVGAAREDKTLAAVLPRLQAGDVVEVDAGTYHETAKIAGTGRPDAPIILRGVGNEYPLFDAQGMDTSGQHGTPRGVFEITGAYVVVEHLAFRNARNGMNAAGVRFLDSTNATLRDCKISDCDMGVFGGDKETATIEYCEVFNNGTEKFNGGSHNFYMHGNRAVVRGCYIHDSLFGQNYKSRAHYNELWYNWITDSNEGEVGCVDAPGNTDRPNSNVLMFGNTVLSKAERTGNAAKYVLFGSELGSSHNGTLYLFQNTFIAGNGRVQFITLDDPLAHAVVRNNVFTGSNNILRLARPAVSVEGNHNLLPGGTAPEGWTNQFGAPLEYVDGDGVRHRLNLVPTTAAITVPVPAP